MEKDEGPKDNNESLVDQVYHMFLNQLLNNEIVPGMVLNRKDIAKDLQVSMAPVREALARLTREGFIDTLPRRGTVVKAINKEDVHDLLVLREAIECQAARIYCGQAILEHRSFLEACALEVDEPIDDLIEHWKRDIQFHHQLVALTCSKSLSDSFKRVMRVGTFYQVNTFLAQEERQERLSHKALIEELTTDDPDRAEKIIRDHLKSGKRHFYKG
ncbi:GntR family transcriptional regulator [Sediminispirochaeta bajacaliforniensis]|uniref:GntR family transcriptional regulator n=1 Tax=Sediminispirochaeta bajacaliforniensis TaxID=148 RepID=UPI00036839D7|nr:GntR family transcriptional regulator [Sediminispirochaeta bajacaliforniensis]